MSLLPETVARRNAYTRPGYSLIGYEPVALPAFRLTLEAVGERRKAVSPIEEFALYCVDAGLDDPKELAEFLGLHETVVERALVNQWQLDNIGYIVDSPGGRHRLTLTERGARAKKQLVSTTPEQVEPSVTFDRLLWSVTPEQLDLMHPRDMPHLQLVRPRSARQPDTSDLDVIRLNQLLTGTKLRMRYGPPEEMELLAVRRVKNAEKRHVSAVLLVWTSPTSHPQVGAFIDGHESEEHSASIAELGGVEHVGLAGRLTPILPERVPVHVRTVLVSEATVADLEAEAARLEQMLAGSGQESDDGDAGGRSELQARLDAAQGQLARMPARMLPVWRHRAVLDAATTAQRRLLISARRLRSLTVDDDFLARLRSMLEAGTAVDLAIPALGDDGRDPDRKVEEVLKSYRKRYPKLSLARYSEAIGNTLIADGAWVISEFPWLAHQGDRRDGFRREQGIVVIQRDAVDRAYADALRAMEGSEID